MTMKTKITGTQLFCILVLVTILCSLPFTLKAYIANDFHWRPPFTMANEIPSITILLDSSDAMHRMAYAYVSEPNSNIANAYQEYGHKYDPENTYLGYFKDTWYSYNNASNYFEVNSTGETQGKFHGNFMNWATMHRLDVARIILTGGSYNNSTKTFDVIVTDAVKDQYSADEELTKKISGNVRPVLSNSSLTPYSGLIVQVPQTNTIRFYDKDPNKFSNAKIVAGDFYLKIKDDSVTTPKGVLDDYADRARFALARYYIKDADKNGVHDSKSNTHKGAMMLVHMDQYGNETMNKIKEQINMIWPSSKAAPLAEAVFTVSGYVKQMESPNTGPKYESDSFTVSKITDPYYFKKFDELVSCTQQNIILITPGESAFGDSIPIGDNSVVKPLPYYPRDYDIVNNGKYHIQDVAHWMHTNDLRNDLNGTQNIDLFVVRAFGVEDTVDVLKDAAMFGGFRDRDGENLPLKCSKIVKVGGMNVCDGPESDFHWNEFDLDDDQIPDNYFAADDDDTGEGLRKVIIAAFEAATRRVTSGTAAAVTSQTRSGDGAVYQALFFPPTESSETPLAPPWSGQVHAMLVDSEGNIREDTNGSGYLDDGDSRIVFMGDLIARYSPNSTTPEYLNNVQEIKFLWSSSTFLNGLTNSQTMSQRAYEDVDNKRYIFTFNDADNSGTAPLDGGEIQPFDNATCALSGNNFCNYLTLFESTSRELGIAGKDKFSNSSILTALAKSQVDFIRGAEISGKLADGTGVRSRSLNATSGPWRLGDVVYSSPTIVGAPSENYHLIYKDNTYKDFYTKYRNRRQMLYVGANDGMLHAFNAGFYNSTLRGFNLTAGGAKPYPLGMELWAYVPYNLLPHLKWLMNPDYGGALHVPYMDLKPRIFDARIFVDSNGASQNATLYPHGWGTVLVAGMRFGGAEITVDSSDVKDQSSSRNMTSAYVVMDITNPEAPPNLLAEIRMPDQGFTTCYPTVMPMATAGSNSTADSAQNHWFLVFGSGPASAAGNADAFITDHRKPAVSLQAGKLYVLDLKTLAETRKIRTLNHENSFVDGGSYYATTEEGSFIGDPIAVDLDIGSSNASAAFKTDVVYFGTVAGDETTSSGTMRRLKTNNNMPSTDGAGANWSTNMLIDVGLPVTSAASAAVDETNRLWIYFGAGRFYNRDDIAQTKHMSFFGIKEPIDDSTTPKSYTWDTVDTGDLFNSTRYILKSTAACGTKFTKDCIDVVDSTTNSTISGGWDTLVSMANSESGGWRQDFIPKWERVLGQPAILGGTVLFTTYIPDTDICEPEGLSRLYGLYYKTGTAYYDPILGVSGDTLNTFVGLGKGLAITPSVHVGDDGVTAYIQTSSGAIETLEVTPPLSVRPGPLFWRKNTN